MSGRVQGIPEPLYARLEHLKPILLRTGSIHRKSGSSERFVLRYSLMCGGGKRVQGSLTLGEADVAEAVAALLLAWRSEPEARSETEGMIAKVQEVLAGMDGSGEGQRDWFQSSLPESARMRRITARGTLY